MKQYHLSDIQIHGEYRVDVVLDFSMDAAANNHGVIHYKGLIHSDRAKEVIYSSAQSVDVYVGNTLEFSGFVTSATIDNLHNNNCTLEISAVSHTKTTDRQEHKRFFQDVQKSSADVLAKAFDASGYGASLIATKGKEHILRPLLQYGETDWQFALRIASNNHTVLIPNVRSNHPQMCLGFPASSLQEDDHALQYTMCSNRPYLPEAAKADRYATFFELDTTDCNYFLGDRINANGQQLYVVRKQWKRIQEYAVAHYILAPEESASIPQYRNEQIAGLELGGKVVATLDTVLKAALDVDCGKDQGKRYWFEYTANTNNAMYCMPLVGERVSYQWQSHSDADILVTRSVRGANKPVLTPAKRHWSTEFRSRLSMIPEGACMKTPYNLVELHGDNGTVKSRYKISLSAAKSIKFKSRNAFLATPGQIRIRVPDSKGIKDSEIWMGMSEINIRSNHVDIRNDKDGIITQPPVHYKEKAFQIETSKAVKILSSQPQQTIAK